MKKFLTIAGTLLVALGLKSEKGIAARKETIPSERFSQTDTLPSTTQKALDPKAAQSAANGSTSNKAGNTLKDAAAIKGSDMNLKNGNLKGGSTIKGADATLKNGNLKDGTTIKGTDANLKNGNLKGNGVNNGGYLKNEAGGNSKASNADSLSKLNKQSGSVLPNKGSNIPYKGN